MDYKENDIPVPWGHVSAKLWGDKNNPPVLVAHGILDNAGAFDDLIPLLPTTFYYICIDLPGHGKSSYFPKFFPETPINYIPVFKLLINYFNYQKWIILGHSYGGQIGLKFAQIYPEHVEKIILLDTLHLYPVPAKLSIRELRMAFDKCIEIDEKLKNQTQPPTYTYEEAIEKLKNRRHGAKLEGRGVENLAKRMLISSNENDGKYYFSYDQRIKAYLRPLHDFRYIIETFKKYPVNCPVLFILATESEHQTIYFKPFIDYVKTKPNYHFIFVKGNHDVHNNNPELVAPHVTKFLLNVNSKL